MSFTLSARSYFRVFGSIAVVLTLLSFGIRSINHYALHNKFNRPIKWIDVDEEQSVPTWFSSVDLVVTAVLVAAVVLTLRQQGNRKFRAQWIFLAVGFVILSIDEAIAFHEIALGKADKVVEARGIWRFTWVLPALVILAGVAAFFFKFVINLEPRRRLQFIVAGVLFVGASVGLEMVGGKLLDYYEEQAAKNNPVQAVAKASVTEEGPSETKSSAAFKDRLPFMLEAHTEEFLEMFSIVMFNAALIEHLAELTGSRGLTINFVAMASGKRKDLSHAT